MLYFCEHVNIYCKNKNRNKSSTLFDISGSIFKVFGPILQQFSVNKPTGLPRPPGEPHILKKRFFFIVSFKIKKTDWKWQFTAHRNWRACWTSLYLFNTQGSTVEIFLEPGNITERNLSLFRKWWTVTLINIIETREVFYLP